MNATELISLLSEQGSEDLSSSLQWISPIPENINELVQKITMALQIVKFSQSRCAEEAGGKSTTLHSDALTRLKSEIENIVNNNK